MGGSTKWISNELNQKSTIIVLGFVHPVEMIFKFMTKRGKGPKMEGRRHRRRTRLGRNVVFLKEKRVTLQNPNGPQGCRQHWSNVLKGLS